MDKRSLLARGFWLALGLLIFCSGCQREAEATTRSASAELERSELRYQGFAGTVTFPELAEDLGYLAPLRLEYVGNTISGPQDIQTVVTGDTDFGGAFNGAVIKLIAAKAPVVAVIGSYGVDENTWSGFYVLQGSAIQGARDFIGKKVAVNTLGAHHEFVLREYLARNGLKKEEIAQVTWVVVPPVSGEQALRQGQVDIAVLGGILRDKALERGGLTKVFSDYELYGEFTAGSYVLGRDFVKRFPKTARRFVEGTGKAIEWARATPRAEVIARFESIIARRGRNEDASAVRYWKSTGVAGSRGLIQERDYQVWIDWLVKDGQLGPGQVKAGDLYTNQLNSHTGAGS